MSHQTSQWVRIQSTLLRDSGYDINLK